MEQDQILFLETNMNNQSSQTSINNSSGVHIPDMDSEITHTAGRQSLLPSTPLSSELDPPSRSNRSLVRLIVAATLVLLPLIYFLPAVKGDIVLAIGDSWSYSILLRMLLGQMIAQGTLPLWNPYTFAGMPLLASVQPGVLYPLNWFFAVFSPGVAINIVVITTYHIALIGSYLYARALRLGRMAALVTGLTFTFSGFMISHLEQVNYIAALAWLPWMLLLIDKLSKSTSWIESWQTASLGAIIIALHFFAGLPQATLQIALVCCAYFFFLLAGGEDRVSDWRVKWRFTAAISAMVICGITLSAIQLLPTRELQLQGERAAIPYEAFAIFSMPPRRLLSFIMPFFFGGALPQLYHVGGWDYWWLHKYIHGYIGIVSLLLITFALIVQRSRGIIWFWAGVAAIALILAFGDHLPFEIHRLLYRIPGYNLFRAPYRHTYEFTFAMAVLAGFGMDALSRRENANLRRALLSSSIIVAIIFTVVAVVYRFFTGKLSSLLPPPLGGNALTNPEFFVPLIFLLLGIGALCFYLWKRTILSGTLVLILMFLDLVFFGWFTYWRTSGYQLVERLKDPAAVKAIKERESDLNNFRILSYAVNPYNRNYEDLCHANLAIARGLQSASGYDPMRLSRVAAMSGDMDIFGMIGTQHVFGVQHQGLNLLNVKYLLRERKSLSADDNGQVITIEGIRFASDMAEMKFGPGTSRELEANGASASELAIISTMTDSAHIADNTPVAKVTLYSSDNRRVELQLLAGRDTAEWAYDRSDVRSIIKHSRAKVAESWNAESFQAHRYLARLSFPRAEIARIEISYLEQDGGLVIARASLYDVVSGLSSPVESALLPNERWRRLASFGEIDLYENMKVLPRAWFVNRLIPLPDQEALRVIKQGTLADGTVFDPTEVALLTQEDGASARVPSIIGRSPGTEVKVVSYEPQRVVWATSNQQAGFLVLSEVYYRGWEARVDGVPIPVERVNYTLRGIDVPAGEHQVEFTFRSPSFRTGALISAFGATLLIIGTVISQLRLHRVKR